MIIRMSMLLLLSLSVLSACGDASDPAAETTEVEVDGVEVRTIKQGYGRAVEAGDFLTVHTTGWLYDEDAPQKRGEKFWSSEDSGDKLQFTLGAGQMIQGWDRGLPGTLIGEVRELTIPPELGYGADGRGPIPPNSTLVFEVELFGAVGPTEAPEQ